SPEAANYSSESWYAPGGQGYLDAMRAGHNDPNSDPNNPQPFSDAALTAAGIDPATYRSANAPQSGGITDWGGREDLNRGLYDYLQEQGYNPTFSGFGGEHADNFGNWLAGQTAEVQADV